MLIEAHSSQKPARPHHAAGAAAAFLVFAGLLAAGMASRRAGSSLGLRVAPTGWEVSFRPPRAFRRGEPIELDGVTTLRFYGVAPNGAAPTLAVSRIETSTGAGVGADAIALWLAQGGQRGFFNRGSPNFIRSVERLGPHEAVELRDSAGTAIIRAAVLRSGSGLAVTLTTKDAPFDQTEYLLFDLTCRSVQYD